MVEDDDVVLAALPPPKQEEEQHEQQNDARSVDSGLAAPPQPEHEKNRHDATSAECMPAPGTHDAVNEDEMKNEGDGQDDPGNGRPFLLREEQQAMMRAAVQEGGRGRGRGRGKGRGRAGARKASECEQEAIPKRRGRKPKAPASTEPEPKAEPEAEKHPKARAKKQPKAQAKNQPKAQAKNQPKAQAKRSTRKRPAAAEPLGKTARVPVHNIYKHTALDVYWTRPAVGLKLRSGDQKQALQQPTCVIFHGMP